jgi:hypothetical protein
MRIFLFTNILNSVVRIVFKNRKIFYHNHLKLVTLLLSIAHLDFLYKTKILIKTPPTIAQAINILYETPRKISDKL